MYDICYFSLDRTFPLMLLLTNPAVGSSCPLDLKLLRMWTQDVNISIVHWSCLPKHNKFITLCPCMTWMYTTCTMMSCIYKSMFSGFAFYLFSLFSCCLWPLWNFSNNANNLKYPVHWKYYKDNNHVLRWFGTLLESPLGTFQPAVENTWMDHVFHCGWATLKLEWISKFLLHKNNNFYI